MMRKLILVVMSGLLAACSAGTSTAVPQATRSSPTAAAPSARESTTDLFTANSIELAPPACNGTLTTAQTEGPYYTPGSPERNSLLEAGIVGTRLTVVGYVLDADCRPITNAWLDFWQADGNGVYDNVGQRLRGHQYTDAHGRFFLETVMPGLYPERPIPHIHVKVQAPNGDILTTQLYFPEQPVGGLTVELEDRGDYQVAYFDFVVE